MDMALASQQPGLRFGKRPKRLPVRRVELVEHLALFGSLTNGNRWDRVGVPWESRCLV